MIIMSVIRLGSGMEQGAKINKLVPQETKPIFNGVVVEDLWNGAKRKREDVSGVTAKKARISLS